MSTTLEKYPKLVNAILYIASNPQINNLGKVKLWKLLYYADSLFCKVNNHYITEAVYIKLPKGPVPEAGEELLSTLKDLKLIEISKKEIGKEHIIFEISATQKPELSLFSEEEVFCIESVIQQYSQRSAKELSEVTHLHAGWVFTEPYKEIDPLYSKYLGKEDAEGL